MGRRPRRSRPVLVCGLAAVSLLIASLLLGACLPPTVARPGATQAGPVPGASSSDGPAATPGPTPSGSSGPSSRPSFVRPTPNPQPTFLAYVVKPGDTLTSIALEFRTTARSLAFWNREAHPSLDPDSPDYRPNRIEVGWILLLVPDQEVDPEEFP